MIPKFRVWDKNNKSMHEVRSIWIGDDFPLNSHVVYSLGNTVEVIFDDIELMQATGLKDKNGVEIFEGDIVLVSVSDGYSYLDNETTIVQQSEFHAGLICKLPVSGVEYRIFKRSETGYEYEVIGNIYENPELLEEVKK